MATVAELGEFALIDRWRTRIGSAPENEVWSGDDAAVIASPGDRLVLTTDVLVEGIDFDLRYAEGPDIGWKAMASNLSDVAAMGGRPRRAVATLTLRPDTSVGLVDGILEGMLELSGRWDVGLVGGDVSGSPTLSLGVTVVGVAEIPLLRSGARIGDVLCVTGELGGAAGGLLALKDGRLDMSGLIERQLRPAPRVAEGVALAQAGASAMIDVSDGLAADLDHLVSPSGVGCEVDIESIPVDPALAGVADLIWPMEAALTGGEDFELLVALPEERVGDATEALTDLGTVLTRIGRVTQGAARIGSNSISEWRDKGWEHLRRP
ncbi:MAG TPA: thiamine-phosphate kinase [Actinomycetota bacterium]|nr:thiamine-phosphate kinase [Actinomycetota bacterium]